MATAPKVLRLSTGIELDTDAVSPDSLKAAFDVAIDAMISRAEGHHVALNWNSLEVALSRVNDDDTILTLRAGVVA